MSSLITGTNDKLNKLASILLYVYRCQAYNKTFSKEIVTEAVESIKAKNEDIINLKDIIKEMIASDVNKSTLIDNITLTISDDSPIIKKLIKLINTQMEEKELSDYLSVTAETIAFSNKFFKHITAINNTSFTLNTKEMSLDEQIELLKSLKDNLKDVDSLALEEVDNGDDIESISVGNDGILINLNKVNSDSRISLQLGWEELNTGVAGSLSTGELVVIEALQHKNKTGFTLSLFLQTLLNNKVVLEDGKKPLWLWVSLEDDLAQIVVKIFVYLYFRKHKNMPDMLELSSDYINKFVKEEIEATGNTLELKRIDNTKFSIEKFKGIYKAYELRGYRIITCAVDYLEKAYTDGAKYNTGAIGSGLKNMFTMFRTFAQEKGILFMTPHQIAVDALNITRNGADDIEFLKMIVGKNYTQGSKGLPQEFDVEILIHLCNVNGIDYQAVQIGKLKRPSFVASEDKFMLIPFEKSVNSGKGKEKLLAPLMEDCSASNPIVKNGVANRNVFDL